ncbi:MAG: hypothetical protein M9894_16115 [Planctomycetes bacterium]|nr:hypothetical protein [Planctomycetota bacterium]
MPPLDMAQALDEAEKAIQANVGYRADRTGAQARAYAAGLRAKAALVPSSSAKGPQAVAYNVGELLAEAKRADDWADAVAGTSVVRTDFRRLRANG